VVRLTTISEHVQQLKNQMNGRRGEHSKSLAYYKSEHRPQAVGIATPPEMRRLLAACGWPRIYVDSVGERLDLEGFRLAGEGIASERLWAWWQRNNLDLESSMGHLEALIHGIAYVTIAAPDPSDPLADQEIPSIRVESARDMHAEIDPVTGRVKRAIRPYKLDGGREACSLLLPDVTYQLARSTGPVGEWEIIDAVEHGLGVVLVVPLVNRSGIGDREGSSEITRELRSVTDAAARTVMNLQAATELMAVPQRLLFGVAKEEFSQDPNNPGAVFDAYYARMLAFENESGRAEQFAAAELRNFVEAMRELATQAASYTGLPMSSFGLGTDNPASAEAIQASETRLVKKAERKARMFGSAWEEVMRLALLVMDGVIPQSAFRMESIWRNPATPTYAAKADGVTKLYANGMGVIPLERARMDMGYTEEERKDMQKMDRDNPTAQLSALLAPRPTNDRPDDKLT
jgi:hypothetical protein